ncbi:MAG: hypothetical protein WCS20_03645 [Alphaproteobacteria bacterium]
MIRLLTSLLAVLSLVACTRDHIMASDAEVARARYVDPNPASITLLTSFNTRTKAGVHSALLINGSQRVLYDPAGNWAHPAAPERNDLHYGMTPQFLALYADFQGTAPFELLQQTIFVTPEVADQVIRNSIAHGSANKAACTNAIGQILRPVPGFESLPRTLFPKRMSVAFGRLPGVQSRTITSLDGDLRKTIPGLSLAGSGG